MTVPRRVAIYARVSTTEQNPEVQLRSLREYANGRGFVVHDEYVDRLSGDVIRRSRRQRRTRDVAFDRLMVDAHQRRFDCVLVWKYDRFARSLGMLIAALQQFNGLGIDFISYNRSDVQPDTVHADTQGQSAPIFGLAHLLGIQLMPRIRNWKDLHLYRPAPDRRYGHIDELFTGQIDWALIETMLPDMLRVAVSIRSGRITASAILNRLSTYSRKNRLYFAFRELGRVIRTIFLLRYLSDVDLRRKIQAATNKSELFNEFAQWVFFGGGGIIAEGVRDEQRKIIKYNHLIANLLIFHNLVSMTRVFDQAAQEGGAPKEEALAAISPYHTEHINRFGHYILDLGRSPIPLPFPVMPTVPNMVSRDDEPTLQALGTIEAS